MKTHLMVYEGFCDVRRIVCCKRFDLETVKISDRNKVTCKSCLKWIRINVENRTCTPSFDSRDAFNKQNHADPNISLRKRGGWGL